MAMPVQLAIQGMAGRRRTDSELSSRQHPGAILSMIGRFDAQNVFVGTLWSQLPPLRHSLHIFSSFSGQTCEGRQGYPPSAGLVSSANSRTSGRAENTERLWNLLFADPSQWWDKRSVKMNSKSPDFVHKHTGEALWIDNRSNPTWVISKLIDLTPGKVQTYVGSDVQVPCGIACQDRNRLSINNRTPWRCSSRTLSTDGLRRGVKDVDYDTRSHGKALIKKGEAMTLLHNYDQRGMLVDSNTYVQILQSFCKMEDLVVGKQVHDHINRSGVEPNIYVVNNIMKMYINCGSVVDARQLLDKYVNKDVVTWTIMIGGYAQQDRAAEAFEVFHKMQQEGVEPDCVTYMSILNACASPVALEWGKEVHAHIIKAGFQSDVRVANALVKMYAKCWSIKDARQVFDKIVNRNHISWNIMVGSYAESGDGEEAFEVFCQMQQEGLMPNTITYMSILNACGSPVALEWGKVVHAHIINAGLQSDVRVATALVKMYAKCGSIEEARQVFDKIVNRNLISFYVMIGAYAESGNGEEAYKILCQMQQEGLKPNLITYMSILNACVTPAALEWGKKVHGHVNNAGLQSDVHVGTALVKMYAKCGSIKEAGQVFDKIVNRNVVTWTVMIGAYAESGHGDKALELFLQMRQEGLEPNVVTFLSILNPCASPGALEWVKEVHAQAIKAGLESDMRVGTALVNMYAKSGSIKDARQVFDHMVECDVISYNMMIGGLAQHGHGQDALEIFEQMKREGVRPNEVTFMGVFSACSHAGLVDECRRHFSSLSPDYGIEPTIEHYGCMVDLLGRAGHLDEAENVIKSMPFEANAEIWGALLGACRIHGNVKLAEVAAEHCFKLEPENGGVYVLLCNIYAAAGMWDHAVSVRNLMKERGVRKEPGRSWIEVDKKVHYFVAEDRSHPQAEEIYAELKKLFKTLKRAGYAPDTRFVMHDVDEQQKEEVLCSHSEKLAIAYGLISTPPGTPIRIFKNLRVCSDCHTATKFISRVTMREIVARDANRFHHFKDGVCSCGDYW